MCPMKKVYAKVTDDKGAFALEKQMLPQSVYTTKIGFLVLKISFIWARYIKVAL